MEGCFIFQWGGGGVFQMVGASFLSGGVGGATWGASVLLGGGVRKNSKDGGGEHPHPRCLLPSMGNSEKNHLIIKNNCSILKEQ